VEKAMNQITLNSEQRMYVIACAEGHSCFGFDNARDHTNQMATELGRHDLAFGPADHGELSGYDKYLRAADAWGQSRLRERTYFDPATDPRAARVLEDSRKRERKVRLILGNTDTGESWLDEYDVVGRIGRSTGQLKVPLLIEPGADGGPAILTACLLAIVDWDSGKFLFRHASFRAPDLAIRAAQNGTLRWEVLRGDEVIARFADIGQAGGYVAFMRGATVEPRIFH
jgi:hypothetical protein